MKKIAILSQCLSILLLACGPNCEKYLDNEISPLIFNGIVVIKKKSTTGCFGDINVKYNGKLDTLNVCYCGFEKEQIWDYVEIGDSIYKPKGSITISVYRNHTKKDFTYPCCNM